MSSRRAGASTSPPAAVFIERERHANVRHHNLNYRVRAIRTANVLYLRNLRPARSPDAFFVHWRPSVDVGTTLTKDVPFKCRDDPAFAGQSALNFAPSVPPTNATIDNRITPNTRSPRGAPGRGIHSRSRSSNENGCRNRSVRQAP